MRENGEQNNSKYRHFLRSVECNLKTVNYLDITLDLNTGTYKLYRNPNDKILYAHVKSNHPENILKNQEISMKTR